MTEAASQKGKLIPKHIYSELGVMASTKESYTSEMAFKQECSEQFSFEAPAAAKLTDLRLPGSLTNCVRIQPQCFDSQLYQIEDNVTFKGELGTVITKRCPVTNFIRWRYSKQDGKKDVEAAKLAALGLQVPQ